MLYMCLVNKIELGIKEYQVISCFSILEIYLFIFERKKEHVCVQAGGWRQGEEEERIKQTLR